MREVQDFMAEIVGVLKNVVVVFSLLDPIAVFATSSFWVTGPQKAQAARALDTVAVRSGTGGASAG
jgi:hypothetical protein